MKRKIDTFEGINETMVAQNQRIFQKLFVWGGRLLFLIFILYAIFFLDWKHLMQQLLQAKKEFIFLAVLSYFIKYLSESARWMYLLRVFEVRIPLLTLFKYILIAPFFAIISIIPKGSQVYLFLVFKLYFKEDSTNLSAILSAKIIGFISILLLAPIALFYFSSFQHFQFDWNEQKLARYALIFLFVIVFLLVVVFILKWHKVKFFLLATLQKVVSTFSYFRKEPLLFIFLLLLTYIGYFFYALTIFFLLQSMQLQLSFTTLFLAVPFIYLFSFFLTGFRGIGSKESALIVIGMLFALKINEIEVLTSLHLLLGIFFIFIGFLLYLKNKIAYEQKEDKEEC